MSDPKQTVDELLALLDRSAGSAYYGEPVSQLEHALQCAQLARDAGASDDMVVAALLHDIGHLLEDENAHRHDEIGVINHDDIGAEYLIDRGFPRRIAELVRGHVDAKRYLTATNPAYAAKLSEASSATLALQGGPMTSEQASEFERDPLFTEKLRLRSWDEQGKKQGWQVAALESYRDALLAQLPS
jgi:phosphonate degradation associated HDIG domain protein